MSRTRQLLVLSWAEQYILPKLKGLGRQLSMRNLGAKFKFSVGHGKFNFPPLYAERASSSRIPVVISFAIETIIAVDMKRYHAWIILWRNFVYFSTATRKNGFKKDRSVRTCRPTDAFSWVCLISSSSLGRLEHSSWVAGLYGGPQLSHQKQMLTANYKSLTSSSNRSQQIQIAHSELQITHSKLQIAHSKLKSPTANKKVAHSKFKLLRANYKLFTTLGVFGYLQPAVQLV